jgi:hypothetical protein
MFHVELKKREGATMLKFFWNGIKENGGKLQTVSYSDGKLINYPEGTISIYKREYSGFTAEIRKAFEVSNDSEMQSDYIVTDVIRVRPDHALYGEVKKATEAKKVHDAKRWAKLEAKRAA